MAWSSSSPALSAARVVAFSKIGRLHLLTKSVASFLFALTSLGSFAMKSTTFPIPLVFKCSLLSGSSASIGSWARSFNRLERIFTFGRDPSGRGSSHALKAFRMPDSKKSTWRLWRPIIRSTSGSILSFWMAGRPAALASKSSLAAVVMASMKPSTNPLVFSSILRLRLALDLNMFSNSSSSSCAWATSLSRLSSSFSSSCHPSSSETPSSSMKPLSSSLMGASCSSSCLPGSAVSATLFFSSAARERLVDPRALGP
mmetsp:Transcript_1597/g.5575  ORF Transcript_1597/g.5575 Transcript_1597/m.5575 type:complete len:257 (-) Transcript_1597:385-1155(-)